MSRLNPLTITLAHHGRSRMETLNKVKETQASLAELHLDGWLLYDFRRCNDLACKYLEISPERLLTRRFFYWIPAQGDPVKIVHRIEDNVLDHLPGATVRFTTWQDLEKSLQKILEGKKHVAMEYSPRNAIPYISKVDAGTIDLIRSFGANVVSSADLLQKYTNVWDEFQLETHLEAAKMLDECAAKTWKFIAESLLHKRTITENDVQQFMLFYFTAHDCVTSDSPICAVNAHSADPHYTPGAKRSSLINPGDFILIDLWSKRNLPRAVFGDITRVGVAASHPTEKQQHIFNIVKAARDKATQFVADRFAKGIQVHGWEVDRVCRDVIQQAGYGQYFTHRTGHNIDQTDHGPGANIDDFETHDDRLLLPGTCFSIEPGIYLPGEFGIRLEYDVYVKFDGQLMVTGGIQERIECLM